MVNDKDENPYKMDWFMELFELAKDFFAAIGIFTLMLAALGYSWGYFS